MDFLPPAVFVPLFPVKGLAGEEIHEIDEPVPGIYA
jgi:hypothetical protein